jgi:hypothetical protein
MLQEQKNENEMTHQEKREQNGDDKSKEKREP